MWEWLLLFAEHEASMKGLSWLILGLLLIAIIADCLPSEKWRKPSRKLKNVLFIAVDDLRTELGTYGHTQIVTPNFDSLASKSLVFERAYCQVAVCSPSRTSLLTGRRPDTNHVWRIANDEYWRNYTNATTIPQYFKENGYISVGMGKIFHPGAPNGDDDIAYSWSLPYYHSPLQPFYGWNLTSSWWSFDGFEDNQLPDGQIADNAIETLRQLKQNQSKGDDRPFFLAVGFHKPHLPFYAPSNYFDKYPPVDQIKLADNPDVPTDFPPIARSTALANRYKDIDQLFSNVSECHEDAKVSLSSKRCHMPDSKARELRRAYYACISYTDAQIGKVLAELQSQGFADDTVIVLWADHGWQLGEHNHWCKFTNFEDATHVPFMIRVPGVTDQGMRTKALVELIDIFPSVTELAGLVVPPVCPEDGKKLLTCVEGTSVAPLLENPDRQWKKAAFSQYPRPASGMKIIPNKPPFPKDSHEEAVMGYTIRVDSYRFTEWYGFDHTTATTHFDDIWGTELYNHTEPVVFFNDENVNLAVKPEMKSLVEDLRHMLQAGWRAALPPD